MKIKLNFTDEQIALIKAMDFTKLDIREIMNSYNFVDNVIKVYDQEIQDYTEYRIGEILDKSHVSIDGVYGFDTFNLWGGTYVWEQMAYILGYQGAIVPSSLEDPTGPKFYELVYTGLDENGRRVISLEEQDGLEPINVLEHLKDLEVFIIHNLENIMTLILQFCTEGIQPGVTYWAYDYQRIWHKEE